MAIIENRVTEEGDVLIIKPEAPIIGLISLFQFVDTTTGEVPPNYFLKEFRYSVNGGLTFEPWTELSLINIQSVSITAYDQFVIEYRYTRMGNAPEVELTFENILVSGTVEALSYPVYETMPPFHFFNVNDINVFGWAINVLEKLYRKGLILPDYMERAENNSNLEDEDFIVFWNSITHMFAIIVYFARQFEKFETNEILLTEFLKNKDLAFSDGNDLADLLYIYSNYVAEYKKRGTLQIIKTKAQTTNIDGELLRLIDYKIYDEFIFCLMQNFETGWCLGKSSPMWSNTENITNLIKGYEFTQDITSLGNYPLLNPAQIALTGGYMVIDEVAASDICGIDYTGVNTFKIPVDPSQDYEISFRVKQEALVSVLSFGVRLYHEDGTEISPVNFNSGAPANYFFENQTMKKVDTEYWVRGILWNHSQIHVTDSVPNIGLGDNLKNDVAVNYIVPIITVTSGAGITTKTYIRDVKIKPVRLNFSRGQLGARNIIYLLMKKNNKELTDIQVKDFIEKKLIPYNCFVKIKYL